MFNMILIACNIEILLFLDDSPCFSRAVIWKLLFANFVFDFFPAIYSGKVLLKSLTRMVEEDSL